MYLFRKILEKRVRSDPDIIRTATTSTEPTVTTTTEPTTTAKADEDDGKWTGPITLIKDVYDPQEIKKISESRV